mmetsp:Transcript_10590/g.65242  ORF Transcript_10590/g.65242 Transcript_10590/m.65242 type:complete len:219 (-) Transcript_10590:32-688(-)
MAPSRANSPSRRRRRTTRPCILGSIRRSGTSTSRLSIRPWHRARMTRAFPFVPHPAFARAIPPEVVRWWDSRRATALPTNKADDRRRPGLAPPNPNLRILACTRLLRRWLVWLVVPLRSEVDCRIVRNPSGNRPSRTNLHRNRFPTGGCVGSAPRKTNGGRCRVPPIHALPSSPPSAVLGSRRGPRAPLHQPRPNRSLGQVRRMRHRGSSAALRSSFP